MSKIYYLSSCDTCKRILKEWEPLDGMELRDIKKDPLNRDEIEELRTHSGSYEALINKRARMYRERGLNKQSLSEEDSRELLLEHYTFLKRPVLLTENDVYVGNSKVTVAKAKDAIHP